MSFPHGSPRVSLRLLSQRCGNNLLFAQHLIVYKTCLYKLCFVSLTRALRGDENVPYFSDEQTKGRGSFEKGPMNEEGHLPGASPHE